MQQPQAFCRAVMHEYERQWSHAGGHAVRHPLRLKMERLKTWCDEACSIDEFEQRLTEAQASDDIGVALLADELWPMWRAARAGQPLPITDG
jgi:hypothetical protein